MKYIQNINNKTIILKNNIDLNLSVRMKTSFLNNYEEYLLRNL